MQDAEIIREYHEAEQAVKLAMAEALAKDEYAALPKDVREARAGLECSEEVERFKEAVIAYDQMNVKKHERLIVAHEILTANRAVN
jgi:hypothetical protein